MEIFEVEISPGVTETVEAKNADEARKKVKALIAQGALSPFYDELFFDYETGVDNKRLRRNLALAETTEEQNKAIQNIFDEVRAQKEPIGQENKLVNEVGEQGFIRNTKGQMALTPYGMRQLGLENLIKERTLTDGSTIKLNTIIDENDFNLLTGDLSDLAGVAGPILGTITGFIPQTRILKGMTRLMGNNAVLGRMLTAGVGSTSGKAAEEEVVETVEGFQLQERDEINDLYKQEFVFGSLAQGLGEGVFKIYQTFLGKRVQPSDSRVLYNQNQNRSVADIMKLDRELGKEATERQIKDAIKKGKVKRFDWKMDKSAGAVPAQQSLERMLPGRAQSIAEQVLGNNRDKANASYLFAELNYLLKGIKNERSALDSYISSAQKGRLDKSIDEKLQSLRSAESDVTNRLDKLLKDVTEDALEIGNYGHIPSRKDFGDSIKNTVSSARAFVTKEMGEKYQKVDNLMKDMRSIYKLEPDDVGDLQPVGRAVVPGEEDQLVLKTGQAKDVANAINAAINTTANEYFEKGLLRIKTFKSDFPGYDLSIQDPLVRGTTIDQVEKKFLDLYRGTGAEAISRGEGVSLFQLRNFAKDLDIYIKESPLPSPQRELLIDLKRLIDSTGFDTKRSIMTDLGKKTFADLNIRLKRQGISVTKQQADVINNSLAELRSVNLLNAQRMQPFDNLNIQKIISNAKIGSTPPDDIYQKIFLGGSTKDLEDLFKAVRNYDEYLVSINKPANTEAKLKAQLKQKLFDDAIYKATDGETRNINFTTFARQIMKFDKEMADKGKIDILFQDKTGNSSGELVRKTIFNLNRVQPNLKPKDLRDLVADFSSTKEGLNANAKGKAFIRGLTELANESEKVLKFRANRAIADLPEKGIEATTDTIFRPGNAKVIEDLKATVDDDVFNSIQQASMMKLLKRSVDFNGNGRINDIFKSGNLETALNSYGDETLEAMFGKETTRGLRDFQKQVDILTAGEIGRGGSAGGLVAAGLGAAVVFAPLASLKPLLGLVIARTALSNPRFVGLLSKNDPGSIAQAVQIMERAARQYGVRSVDGSFVEGTVDFADELFEDAKTAVGITDEQVEEQTGEGLQMFQQMRDQINELTKPIQPVPEVPDVVSPDLAQAQIPDPLSEERIEFAERVAGRPILG